MSDLKRCPFCGSHEDVFLLHDADCYLRMLEETKIEDGCHSAAMMEQAWNRRADDDWRPITSHDGRYIVSRDGQVRRVDGMILKQRKNSDGYMIVRLSKPRTTERVHRLVAEAFIPNLERKPSINHINNKRDDNRVCNLEWCTQSENLSHADRQGRMQRNYWVGKRSPNAKLSREDVEAIKREYANGGVSYLILSNRYKTSKRTIGRIINGESYGPLPNPPQPPRSMDADATDGQEAGR